MAATPPDNSVLELSQPFVNGQTRPVEHADIGMPLVAYDLETDGGGAVVLVDPPFVGTMDPGDVMELWLEGEPAVLDSVTIVDENARTTLRIPKGRLHPDRLNMLYYTVRRGSNNRGTSTPPLQILYNRIRPGLKDRYDAPGGHSELKLLLPDEIKNGVGTDFVSAEVCVAYPYCRAYDVITLKCNGEFLEPKPRVNPNQAPPPPNPGDENPITICFTITRAFLDTAKRLDKKLHFSYTVTDQLGNGPDTDAPWSPVQTVDEDLDGTRLPMPILREIFDDSSDDPKTIDLKKLAGNPLLVIVSTQDNRFVAGYDVIATYTTTGQTDPVVVSGKVEADPVGAKLTLVLQVPNAKVFAGSSVTVTYELRNGGDPVGTSDSANAQVTGSTEIVLLPPTLVAPATSPIDVLAYPNGVTVRIEYSDALLNDRARLVEVNPPTGTPQFPLVEFNSNKRVNTVLSAAFLAARHDNDFELRWNLNRNGGQAGKSPVTQLSVLKIVDGDLRLPKPSIAEEDGQILAVQNLTSDSMILATKWLAQQAGQSHWITCKGVDNNGTPISTDVRSGEPNDSADGLSVPAPVDWLKTLKDGTTLTVECAVSFDGSRDRTKAVVFPLRIYSVKSVLPLNPGADKTLNLTTFIVAEQRPPLYTPAEAIFTQTASGGLPPYTYSSTNTAVASVSEREGTVTCKTNGSTRINIRDTNGTQASYLLTVLGIKTLLRNDSTWRAWSDAYNYCAARGGRLATLSEMRAFYDLYSKERGDVAALLGWPLIHEHPHNLFGLWLADGGGGSHSYFNLTGHLGNSGIGPWGTNGDSYGRPALCLYG